MDDLEKELSEILSDKDKVEQLQKMAQTLFNSGVLGDNGGQKSGGENADLPPYAGDKNPPDFPFDIGKLSLLFKSLKEAGDDHAVQLINALIPYLEKERKQRAQRVIKILRLMGAVPLLKESGILDDRF